MLGKLSNSGQYSISSHSQGTTEEKFVLVQRNNQWRISSAPGQVLLTQSDFVHVYQPRNIYFFDPAEQTLVPDPIYVPEEATPADLVKQLVRVVMAPPSGWLRNAVQTAFPARTKLLTVSLDGGTAVVNLGGAVYGASEDALHQMSAQLLWTLAGSSADEPTIQSVELEINGTAVERRPGQPGPAGQLLRQLRAVRAGPRQLLLHRQPRGGPIAVRLGSGQRATGRAGGRAGGLGGHPAGPGRRVAGRPLRGRRSAAAAACTPAR